MEILLEKITFNGREKKKQNSKLMITTKKKIEKNNKKLARTKNNETKFVGFLNHFFFVFVLMLRNEEIISIFQSKSILP